MKRIIILFLLISFQSFAQRFVTKNYESEELKDVRNVKIYLPKSYDLDSIANFPLAIVLDADELFDSYIGNANYFAATDNAPEQIVVGVFMKETSKKDASYIKENSELTDDSKKFFRFLKTELLPYVEANYKTSPFISIVGKGYAGNLITHFLSEKEPIFNAYICINPILAQDVNQQIENYYLNRYAGMDNTFYFYLSSNPFMPEEYQKRAIKLSTYLKSVGAKNLHTVYDNFQSSPSPTSSVSEAFPRAFTKIFEIYAGITKEEYEKNLKQLSPLDAISYLENKYLEIEFLFGSNLGIREQDIYAIEDIIIDKENGDYLKDFGEMILKLYPSSHIGNYYLGRYYESGKKYKSALKQYRLGYGKMNPANPDADLFYENVQRVLQKG